MRVLLTGGAGFIGSHLADRLLEEGHQVFVIDNLLTGNHSNLQAHGALTFEELDVCSPWSISGHFDWVMHLASPASPIDYQKLPLETLDAGSLGTKNALEFAKIKGSKFFFASTSEVYGDPLVHPQPEDYWGNVNPNGLRSVYDEAKRFSEAMIMAYQRTYGLDVRIVRIFNTYGPRNRAQDGRVVPSLINQALNGEPLTIFGRGEQSRSFQYVSDLVEGIRRTMEGPHAGPINLGNPREFSILELAGLILKLTESRSRLRFEPLPQDDPTRRRPDISMARSLLGWEPQVNLEAGLQKTIAWYRQQLFGGPPVSASASTLD